MENAAIAGRIVTELLKEQSRTRPNDIAVLTENASITYRELLEGGLDVASCLLSSGISRDQCVGVFAGPSTDLVVGVWGVLLAGSAYLPLSPDYPDERLRLMLADARAPVVLAQEELCGRLVDLLPPGTAVITPEDVARFRKSGAADGTGAPPPGPGREDLAYVVYTSGSTGKPKGAMIEHRAIAHQMAWLAREHGLGPGQTVLHKTPVSFDAAQWELLAPAVGACVVVGAPGVHGDPELLARTVGRYGVTVLQCVPTLLQALLDSEALARCTSLTRLFSGGEALSRKLARACAETLPHCVLVNLYGPTECTINTSSHTVGREVPGDGSPSVPIGTPVDGLRYHVLGPDRTPLGAGETGELYISGVQLARGYLNRPDLTAQRFVPSPFGDPAPHDRLYRTGDLVRWNTDGTAQFVGRSDNQVKLNGHRIELDEVRLAVTAHDWVRDAAVLLRHDPRTGSPHLVTCVELSPREAALMDQGRHGAHHTSKTSRLQVRAQLSNTGVRNDAELADRPRVELPGAEATPEQRRLAYARKTYRHYEGGAAREQDVLDALARRPRAAGPRRPEELTLAELGRVLRNFGRHHSPQRLLPKYAYASPGALYAVQLHLELYGIAGLRAGFYYYHPAHHRLVLLRERDEGSAPGVRLHFTGRRSAIEPVYRTNIREVLEIETGHMVGLFEEVLPGHGLDVTGLPYTPAVRRDLECAEDDLYLGSFALVPWAGPRDGHGTDVYVQFPPGSGGPPPGQYRHRDGRLERVSGELVLRQHVIAINQHAYERASVGITLVSRTDEEWRGYIDLGRALQHLQMNASRLGFMPAGYSSRTGEDLPAARRMAAVLAGSDLPTGPSYFCVGGRITEEQTAHEGMREDAVHMRGPAELIRDDLARTLPRFMVPSRVLVLESLPHTANGKLDTAALGARADAAALHDARPVVAPRTATEARVLDLWKEAMGQETVSVLDDFFACGGDSLRAVALVHRLNRALSCDLPIQVVFDCPTVERLAARIDGRGARPSSRLVPLRADGELPPVFCWPGLGGYPMSLRQLAARAAPGRPVYGVQAPGINSGETACDSVEEMAAADVAALRRVRPAGPYVLWGYSFGARVAFEAARLLEEAGEVVEHLVLIAPGSPRVERRGSAPARRAITPGGGPDFRDPGFVAILFSVFAGTVDGPLLDECLHTTRDEEGFADFTARVFPELDPELIRRIVRVVCRVHRRAGRLPGPGRLAAPVTVLPARGDEPSFIERLPGLSAAPPEVVPLGTDHYGVLREPGVAELARAIGAHTPAPGHAARRDHIEQERERPCPT